MEIVIIVAIGARGEIGINGKLPWNLPRDMKHFRECTIGHAVVMGRKTMESIPKLPLKDRLNIVISNSLNKSDVSEVVVVCKGIEESIQICKQQNQQKLFVIGGESIYREFLPMCDRLIITKVLADFNGADVFFPEINMKEWVECKYEKFYRDDKNKFDLEFIEYKRVRERRI